MDIWTTINMNKFNDLGKKKKKKTLKSTRAAPQFGQSEVNN